MNPLNPEALDRLADLAMSPSQSSWSDLDLEMVRVTLPVLVLEPRRVEDYARRLERCVPHPLLSQLSPILGTLAVATEENGGLSEEQIEEIQAEGPNFFRRAASKELRTFLRDPSGLHDLSQHISEFFPEAWVDTIEESLNGNPIAAAATASMPEMIANPDVPSRRYGIGLWAVAASLLVGIGLGAIAMKWFGRSVASVANNPKEEPKPTLALASIPTQKGNPRGNARSVTVETSREGFITIVVLQPGREPRVLPEFGTNEKPERTTPGRTVEIPLPDFNIGPDDRDAIVVVTDTPCHLLIFEKIANIRYQKGQMSQVRSEIETLLDEYRFRNRLIGEVPQP